MEMKMKNDISKPRSRHGHKCSKYKVSQYDDAYMC